MIFAHCKQYSQRFADWRYSAGKSNWCKHGKVSMRFQLNNILFSKLIENNRRRRMYLLDIMSFLAIRKKLLLHINFLVAQLIQSVGSSKPRHQSCQRFNRNTGWLSTTWHTYSDSRFKKTLRVSRKTFQHILEPVRHRLERRNVNAITHEERFAICLYRLGREDYYHTIAEMTGLGVATMCTIVSEVSRAIVEYLWAEKLSQHLPTNQEMFINKIGEAAILNTKCADVSTFLPRKDAFWVEKYIINNNLCILFGTCEVRSMLC